MESVKALWLQLLSQDSSEAYVGRSYGTNPERFGYSVSAESPTAITYHGLDDLAIDLSGFAPTEYGKDLSFLNYWNPTCASFDGGST